MLSKIHANGVKSNEGYVVEIVGPNRLMYSEDKLNLIVETEIGIDKKGRYFTIVYFNGIKHWQPPFNDGLIAEEKKIQLIKRITEALGFLEIKFSAEE